MPSNSPWSTLILIALMVVAFYFLILRPQKKRQQAQAKTMNALVPGARVLLTSGIFGTITSIGVKQAVIELVPGVELTVLKQAIARVASEVDEEPVGEEEPVDDALVTDEYVSDPVLDDRDPERLDREPPTGAEPTTRKD